MIQPGARRRRRRRRASRRSSSWCARCWSRPTSSATSPTLVRLTPPGADGDPEVRRWVAYGASPRGGQALLLGAKVHALLDGRPHVRDRGRRSRRARGAPPPPRPELRRRDRGRRARRSWSSACWPPRPPAADDTRSDRRAPPPHGWARSAARLGLHVGGRMGARPGERRFPGRPQPSGLEIEAHTRVRARRRPAPPRLEPPRPVRRAAHAALHRRARGRRAPAARRERVDGRRRRPIASGRVAAELALALAAIAPRQPPCRAARGAARRRRAARLRRAPAPRRAGRDGRPARRDHPVASRSTSGRRSASTRTAIAEGGAALVVSDFLARAGARSSRGSRRCDAAATRSHLLQVLGRGELEPARALASGELVDVESGDATRRARSRRHVLARYGELLAAHRERLRAACRPPARHVGCRARATRRSTQIVTRDLVRLGLVRSALMLGLANPLGLLALASVAVLIALTRCSHAARAPPPSRACSSGSRFPARRLERQRFRPDLLFVLRLLLLLALVAGYVAALIVTARRRRGGRTRHRARRVGQHAGARGGRQALRPRAPPARRARRRPAGRRAGAARRGRPIARGSRCAGRPIAPGSPSGSRRSSRSIRRPRSPRRSSSRSARPRADPGARVAVLTDLPPAASGAGARGLAGVDWIAIGRRGDNVAITALAVDAPPFAEAADVRVEVVVRNFGAAPRATTLRGDARRQRRGCGTRSPCRRAAARRVPLGAAAAVPGVLRVRLARRRRARGRRRGGRLGAVAAAARRPPGDRVGCARRRVPRAGRHGAARARRGREPRRPGGARRRRGRRRRR